MSADPEGLESLLLPAIEGLGFRLWGVDYRSSPKHAHLKIFIDHDDGIQVDDCSAVSHQVAGVLDVEDPITVAYTLEVSSPGIERPLMKLQHFQLYIGKEVKVRLTWAVNNRKNFLGTLVRVDGDEVVIAVDGEELSFPVNAVKRANLVYDGKM